MREPGNEVGAGESRFADKPHFFKARFTTAPRFLLDICSM